VVERLGKAEMGVLELDLARLDLREIRMSLMTPGGFALRSILPV